MQKKIKKIYRERTICAYQDEIHRLQLVEKFTYYGSEFCDHPKLDYRIIVNRKIIKKILSEDQARKIFSNMVLNIVSQLNIFENG